MSCSKFDRESRGGSQGAINTELDHTYYLKDGKCLTISKPNKIPDGNKYADYNEIASFEVSRRAMSPDREFVGPEKVKVLEQHHYAKRGALNQGGRGPRRRTERSRSRDPSDRDTPHANQRGSASASSGANVRRPSPRRRTHPAGMQPVSCSENDDEPSPASLNSLFEPRDRQLSPPNIDTSTYSSDGSSSSVEVALGQFAEDWEAPKERDW